MRLPLHPSLADLKTAGVRLDACDAATIAREVALRAARGDLPGIPSFHVIRLTDDGAIQVEGPVASGREIELAARLLETLLPPLDARTPVRVPGALRLVVARALRVLDLPPFASLDAFADALARFAAEDPRPVLANLVAIWRGVTSATESSDGEAELQVRPSPRAELTISDLRRARRATRLTLADIAERSKIPVGLLRELEWGYLANWPSGFTGRAHLVRYARAAGLDEQIVLRVALPLLDSWADRTVEVTSVPVVVAEPVEEVEETDGLVSVPPLPLVATAQPPRRRVRWAAALAIPALLAIGLVPAIWRSTDDAPTTVATDGPEAVAAAPAAPAPTAAPAAAAPSEPPAPVNEPVVAHPTSIAAAAFSPAFATTGSAVFYHSGTGPRSAIMRADTGSEGEVLRVTRIVDDRASNFHARPSPDGRLIAFDSDRDGERGVYIADAEGQHVRRVSGDGFAAVPSWSPDGRTLAFVRAEADRPRVWNIWIVDLDTGEQQRLTSHAVGTPWGAAWFPDGKRIAYSHEDRLIVRTIEGRRQSTFNSPIRGRLVRTPAVSPDGRHVVFQVYKNGAWLLDVASGRMRKVLTDPTAEEFTWSPDGRRIAYHSRRTGKWGVRVLEAASLSPR